MKKSQFSFNGTLSVLDSDKKHDPLEFLTLKKERSLRSSVFREPQCFTQLYKLSFISVAIKLLNSFIFSNLWLTDMSFRSMFNGNDSILFFYIRCSKLWT